MPKSIPALVKPALLIWARDKAGYSVVDAASKLGIETERLNAWERGSERPSMTQLRKLGEIYKRPIAVFFLQSPPAGFDPQREFRRLPGLIPQAESPELRLALRTALYRREAAKSLYEELREPLPQLEESIHLDEPEELAARKVRELLGITWEAQVSWPSPHAAFNGWRGSVERQGVLVFQAGKISLSEMRGTSIPRGPLPVILINSADAPHGRIFTLIHEFVHVLLANAGYETGSLEGKRFPEEQRLERASNRFAAAILMPAAEFLAEARKFADAARGDEKALKRFAERIKASPEAILRRLVFLGKAPGSVYRSRRKVWQENTRWYAPAARGGGGPPQEVQIISSRGRGFVSLVLEGYHRHAISSSAVTDLLGIQLRYVEKVARALVAGPGEAMA